MSRFRCDLLAAVSVPGYRFPACRITSPCGGCWLPIRRGFQQYANVRPVRPDARDPVAPARPRAGRLSTSIVVRENTEGEYSAIGGRSFEGTDREVVVQESLFTRRGVDRILRYAFEVARSRPKKHLTWATKSNGIYISMPYWDERARAMAAQYPDVRADYYHIDILTAHVRPSRLVRRGGGLEPLRRHPLGSRAGLYRYDRHSAVGKPQPGAEYPSLFEPVHGLRPRHLRAEHCQPHRPDLVRRD